MRASHYFRLQHKRGIRVDVPTSALTSIKVRPDGAPHAPAISNAGADMHSRARTILMFSAISLGAALSASSASAQVHPDAKTGRKIAEKLCVGCHIVGDQATRASVPADVPSFARIASKPEQTAQSIAGAIVVPHPPMPTIQLTREEIGDIAAYILSLRK
jgi:cytochrome c